MLISGALLLDVDHIFGYKTSIIFFFMLIFSAFYCLSLRKEITIVQKVLCVGGWGGRESWGP